MLPIPPPGRRYNALVCTCPSIDYRRSVSLLLGTVVLLSGCDTGRGTATESFAVRDSGSVRIVESSAPAWGEDTRWFVDSAPMFVAVHSRRDASLTEFQHLLQVQRLGDGSIVVLDMAEPFVRAFGVDGELLWTAVSRGDGPAEIREPALLSRIRGDTLIVEDGQSPKSLMLSPQGRVVGALPSRLVVAPEGIGERLFYPAVRPGDGGLGSVFRAVHPCGRDEESEAGHPAAG